MLTPVSLTMYSALSADHLPVLIDTHCRSSFLNPSDHLGLRTDWSKFQAFLEAGLPSNSDLPNEVAIDACDKELSSTILTELAESTPKCHSRGDTWPLILAHIQNEIRLKTQLRRQWKISRDLAVEAEVSHLQRSVTNWLSKWRNDQRNFTLESLDPGDQSLWKMTRRVMRISTPSPPLFTPGVLTLLDSEKAEALADSLEAHFQPVNNLSEGAVIEVVNEVMWAYSFAPASEPKLSNPT